MKVGINGFGRIGRAVYRANLKSDAFEVVAVNDINPDAENLAYQLNYDSIYGAQDEKFSFSRGKISNKSTGFSVFCNDRIDEVDWDSCGVDLVIDASGILENVRRSRSLLAEGVVKNVVVTHSPHDVDFTLILGVNEGLLNVEEHRLISSSICDATAIAPVLKAVKDKFGVESGHLTTLHPWLGYQNLLDGPASSWSVPGEIHHHYALGRSAIGNLIPKPTSALAACAKVLPGVDENVIGSYSMRTPTEIVGSADLTLMLGLDATIEDVLELFAAIEAEQSSLIVNNNFDPLVSSDFIGSQYSVHIDHRFTSLIKGRLLKLVLWYDNEFGYSSKVCEQVALIGSRW